MKHLRRVMIFAIIFALWGLGIAAICNSADSITVLPGEPVTLEWDGPLPQDKVKKTNIYRILSSGEIELVGSVDQPLNEATINAHQKNGEYNHFVRFENDAIESGNSNTVMVESLGEPSLPNLRVK